MGIDPLAVIEIMIPSRKFRRELSGTRCALCGLGMTTPDVAIATLPFGARALHKQCSGILVEQIQAANDALEGAPDEVLDQLIPAEDLGLDLEEETV